MKARYHAPAVLSYGPKVDPVRSGKKDNRHNKRKFDVCWCPDCNRAWQSVNDYLNDFPKISCTEKPCPKCGGAPKYTEIELAQRAKKKDYQHKHYKRKNAVIDLNFCNLDEEAQA